MVGTSTSCFTANESLGVKGIRGCFTNEYLHLYNKVGIGHPSGWGQGQGNTPDKGLSVYGASCIGYGCAATITSCFAHNLNVQGDVTAHASDRRLKCNIVTIKCATDRIKALRGVEFEWDRKYISDKNLSFTPSEEGKTVGFIAQELENTLPTAVREAPFESTLCRNASWSEKYKTVKAEKILPLLVEATKEQQCVIERQQQQINKLTCQVELLLRKCA